MVPGARPPRDLRSLRKVGDVVLVPGTQKEERRVRADRPGMPPHPGEWDANVVTTEERERLRRAAAEATERDARKRRPRRAGKEES